ncbi:MAG TPA: hypothetical protein VH414_15010 [Lichenihabitans sp.]|jgi:hypothetical protein|nr:hypothetical protein [Lichenihabitans sp.]
MSVSSRPVIRRRRAFGLDHARRPDPARIEAELLARLADARPDIVSLRLRAAGADEDAPALVLVPPDGTLRSCASFPAARSPARPRETEPHRIVPFGRLRRPAAARGFLLPP